MSDNEFDQFIDGTLLGDAFVQKDGRYGFNHSEKQAAYFDAKVAKFVDQGIKTWTGKSKPYTSSIDGREIKPTALVQFRTTKQDRWKQLRALWYPNDTKVVPVNFSLTPTSLAYWYMDDGSANLRNKYVSRGVTYIGDPFIQQFRFYTDGFNADSLQHLLAQLKSLGIEGWLKERSNKDQRYIIVSKQDSRQRMKDLVMPIISTIPSMSYKIDHPLSFHGERLNEEDPSNDGTCDSPILQER